MHFLKTNIVNMPGELTIQKFLILLIAIWKGDEKRGSSTGF